MSAGDWKSDDNLPVAQWEGTFSLWGVDIRCAVLGDGSRVFNMDDMLCALGQRSELDPADMVRFKRWLDGGEP